jgi:hypothetical protein
MGPGRSIRHVVPEIIEGVHVDVLLESSMDMVVRSPGIQDAEPIRMAPMSEAEATSHDGLELLADDLVDSVTAARNLESMCRAEQWMKVHRSALSSRVSRVVEYSMLIVVLCWIPWRDPDKNLICSRGMVTWCFAQRH